MQTIKPEFKAVSPLLHRRYDGKFYNPRFKVRRPNSARPVYGYRKPHGQEN